MNFKIFVINLDGSEDRLNNINSQCLNLNLTFERISAVRGSDLSVEDKNQCYSIEKNKKKYYKLLSDAEIGCSLSHISSWQKIIDDNLDFALVLEDDAILEKSIVDYINQIKTLDIESWDYIKLSHGRKIKKTIDTLFFSNGLSLNTCEKLPSTTTGQFISHLGAKKLLKHVFPICRPIDIDIQHWYEKDIRPLVAIPFPIQNGDFGSDINAISPDRRKIKKNSPLKIKNILKSAIYTYYNKKKLQLPKRKESI